MQNNHQKLGDFFKTSSFRPPTVHSSGRWKYWKTIIDGKQCILCFSKNGTIFQIDQIVEPKPPIHYNCRCQIQRVKAIKAGEATLDGKDGADWQLAYNGTLPDRYILKKEAEILGWINWKGNFEDVAPGRIMGGDIFENRQNKLPSAPGRIWYEADINYTGGYRSKQRIIYSNDNLIFVTYDHFQTFIEIKKEGNYEKH